MVLFENEQCKQIEGFPKYWITTFGRVWSDHSNKWLTPTISQKGNYKRCYVSLGRNNKRYIHRLVAEAFIPNPFNLQEVDHIDTNGLNNNVENLRWTTHQENMNNTITQETIKRNKGWYVEVEEIATGKLFIGYEKASEYSGLKPNTIKAHTANRVKNPKWRLTGKRFQNNS